MLIPRIPERIKNSINPYTSKAVNKQQPWNLLCVRDGQLEDMGGRDEIGGSNKPIVSLKVPLSIINSK